MRVTGGRGDEFSGRAEWFPGLLSFTSQTRRSTEDKADQEMWVGRDGTVSPTGETGAKGVNQIPEL
jgi:hypothetical protein